VEGKRKDPATVDQTANLHLQAYVQKGLKPRSQLQRARRKGKRMTLQHGRGKKKGDPNLSHNNNDGSATAGNESGGERKKLFEHRLVVGKLSARKGRRGGGGGDVTIRLVTKPFRRRVGGKKIAQREKGRKDSNVRVVKKKQHLP